MRAAWLGWLLVLSVPAAERRLTLAEVGELARQQSQDLAAARTRAGAATAQIAVARAVAPPVFRWASQNLGYDLDRLDYRANAGVQWSPPRPGEWRAKTAGAAAHAREVAAQIRSIESRVAAEARLAFRRLAIGEERLRLVRQWADQHAERLSVVRRQVAAGIKEPADADVAELALAEAEAECQQALRQVGLERAALARLIGWPPDAVAIDPVAMDSVATNSAASGPGELEGESRPAADRIADAIRQRSETHQWQAACDQAAASETLASLRRYPWLSSVQVNRRMLFSNAAPSWGIQFGVELPLFRSPAVAEWKAAGTTRQSCAAQLLAATEAIRREVTAALDAVAASSSGLADLQRLYQGPGARIVQRLRDALAAGRSDLSEVLAAEARQSALRERWLARRLDHAKLEYQLEIALGI